MSENIIYKYEIHGQTSILKLPKLHTVLHVGYQNGKICLWINHLHPVVDSNLVEVTVRAIATGESYSPKGLKFLGTVQDGLNPYVLHLFEVLD